MFEFTIGELVHTQDGDGIVVKVWRHMRTIVLDVMFPDRDVALAYFPGIDTIEHAQAVAA